MSGGSRSLPDRPSLRYLKLDSVTVRELLSHTGGVDNPAPLFGDSIPDLATLMGPVISCGGPRGTVRPADIGPGTVTGYTVTVDGAFEPFPPQVSTVPAIAGLWSTGTDLVRLGTRRTHVVLTSRTITVESVDDRLLRSWTNREERPS